MKNRKTTGIISIAFLVFCHSQLIAQNENLLQPNGNIGIGTMSPSAKLDVNGKVNIDSNLLVKESVLIQQDAKIEGRITVDGNVNLGNLPFRAQNQLSGLDFLFLDHNGDVVRGKPIFGGVGQPPTSLSCVNPIGDWRGELNLLYVACPEVNVGINTSLPRVKLDVLGDSYLQRLSLGSANPEQVTSIFHLKAFSSTPFDGNLMVLENQTQKVFQVNNAGLLKTREVLIDAKFWPDYVFENGYKQLSLEEIERHIKEKGHLPGVPSAKEVLENGINVAEMDELLLKKIEEMTLLMIEQNKTITLQSELIKALQVKMVEIEKK